MRVEDARVLVVDDVAANVVLLTTILRRSGFSNVAGLGDPRSVVADFEELRPDIILLDLHMPQLDGISVLNSLNATIGREAMPPVVILTADVSNPTREAALQAGASDFLTKPFDHTEVVLRIRNLLTSRLLHLELQRRNDELRCEVDAQRARQHAAEAERAEKITRSREVLDSDAIEMLFQPIVELSTGAIAGFEALARFHRPPFRPPDEWFAEAAGVGLGLELELHAVSRAIASIPLLPVGTHLAVNVSAVTATSPALERIVTDASGARLVIELTEHAMVADYRDLQHHLDRLRQRGALIAVDDAGTGYAGLQHILRIRPDVVKLDRDLITGIDTDPARYALSSALATFAAQIGAVLVAEGIETEAELQVLRNLGIPWGQGFYLASPAPAGAHHLISTEVGTAP